MLWTEFQQCGSSPSSWMHLSQKMSRDTANSAVSAASRPAGRGLEPPDALALLKHDQLQPRWGEKTLG